MTKICIASSGLGHVARGIEAWADDLTQALAARGMDVMLCKGAGQPNAEYERVIPCWTREATKTRTLLSWMPRSIGWRVGAGSGYAVEQHTFARNLMKLLRTEHADVLHVQDPHVALALQRAQQRRVIKTRTILAHGTEEPLEFQAKITYLQHLAPWHHEVAFQAGVHKDTWATIPNFVDTEHFRPGSSHALRRELKLPSDELVVLVAAAIKRHHKRIDFLVREFRILLDRHPDLNAWLVIAGGWEDSTDSLVEDARRLLGDRVRFLIRFPRQRMADLYRAADLFTLGSLKEMMPIALLEAGASGLPCVVHDHPVMRWMIGPGGISANLSDKGSWAEAVAPLLRSQQRRAKLGKLARQHCLTNFTRDRVVNQIVEYYHQVLGHQALGSSSPSPKRREAAAK